MTVAEGIFLGLLQGFTEFLPVSSSGHLLLAQKLFDIEATLFFDVMLHVGTLLAVVIFMRRSLWQIVRHPIADKRFLLLVAATAVTFAIALPVKLFVNKNLMQKLLPAGFAVTIAIVGLSSLQKKRLPLEKANICAFLTTGAAQGLALFAGLSRSGATIGTMRFWGIEPQQCAEFSFLLSVPVIVAAAVVEGWEVVQSGTDTPWTAVAAGVVAAFLSGLAALRLVKKCLMRGSWKWFALYLAFPLVLSLIVL